MDTRPIQTSAALQHSQLAAIVCFDDDTLASRKNWTIWLTLQPFNMKSTVYPTVRIPLLSTLGLIVRVKAVTASSHIGPARVPVSISGPHGHVVADRHERLLGQLHGGRHGRPLLPPPLLLARRLLLLLLMRLLLLLLLLRMYLLLLTGERSLALRVRQPRVLQRRQHVLDGPGRRLVRSVEGIGLRVQPDARGSDVPDFGFQYTRRPCGSLRCTVVCGVKYISV